MIRWVLGLLIVLAGCRTPVPQQPTPVATPAPSPVPTPVPLEALEQQMADLVNEERAQNGLARLNVHAGLAQVAEHYSKRMIDEDFFEHADRQGETVGDRLRAARLTFQTVGENIGFGTTVASIQTGFLESATHRAVMLDRRWQDFGIGIERVDQGELFRGEGDRVLVGAYVVTQIYRLPKADELFGAASCGD